MPLAPLRSCWRSLPKEHEAELTQQDLEELEQRVRAECLQAQAARAAERKAREAKLSAVVTAYMNRVFQQALLEREARQRAGLRVLRYPVANQTEGFGTSVIHWLLGLRYSGVKTRADLFEIYRSISQEDRPSNFTWADVRRLYKPQGYEVVWDDCGVYWRPVRAQTESLAPA